MERKIQDGECIDVSTFARDAVGHYIIRHDQICARWGSESAFREHDFADSKTEQWIWSIGRIRFTGLIILSLTADMYQNPNAECIWLR